MFFLYAQNPEKCQKLVCLRSVKKKKRESAFWCLLNSVWASVRTDCTAGLPGWAKKKDVLCLGQVNHLSFQSQTADLHPSQLVLVLHSLHIQQALLSGLHHIYEYFIICSSPNLLQNWAPVQLTLIFKAVFFMCL